MIKLFLFTLLCAAVLADSPFDVMNQTLMKGQELGQEIMDTVGHKPVEHVQNFMNQGLPLVRRMAQEMNPPNGLPEGPPPGPPPSSDSTEQ